MPRISLVLGLFIIALGAGPRPAAANELEGAWCAQAWLGSGGDIRDCHFTTFDECWPTIIAGNRGFCTQNPRWAGWNAPAEPVQHHAKRRLHRG